jgi:hypothetical protein
LKNTIRYSLKYLIFHRSEHTPGYVNFPAIMAIPSIHFITYRDNTGITRIIVPDFIIS